MKIVNERTKKFQENPEVDSSLEEVKQFLDKLNIEAITDKPFRYLAVEQIVNSTQLIPL